MNHSTQPVPPIAGGVFVLSGAIPGYTRSQVKEAVEMRGGKVAGAVSHATTALITDETATTKVQRATALGVPIVSARLFAASLNSEGGTQANVNAATPNAGMFSAELSDLFQVLAERWLNADRASGRVVWTEAERCGWEQETLPVSREDDEVSARGLLYEYGDKVGVLQTVDLDAENEWFALLACVPLPSVSDGGKPVWAVWVQSTEYDPVDDLSITLVADESVVREIRRRADEQVEVMEELSGLEDGYLLTVDVSKGLRSRAGWKASPSEKTVSAPRKKTVGHPHDISHLRKWYERDMPNLSGDAIRATLLGKPELYVYHGYWEGLCDTAANVAGIDWLLHGDSDSVRDWLRQGAAAAERWCGTDNFYRREGKHVSKSDGFLGRMPYRLGLAGGSLRIRERVSYNIPVAAEEKLIVAVATGDVEKVRAVVAAVSRAGSTAERSLATFVRSLVEQNVPLTEAVAVREHEYVEHVINGGAYTKDDRERGPELLIDWDALPILAMSDMYGHDPQGWAGSPYFPPVPAPR